MGTQATSSGPVYQAEVRVTGKVHTNQCSEGTILFSCPASGDTQQSDIMNNLILLGQECCTTTLVLATHSSTSMQAFLLQLSPHVRAAIGGLTSSTDLVEYAKEADALGSSPGSRTVCFNYNVRGTSHKESPQGTSKVFKSVGALFDSRGHPLLVPSQAQQQSQEVCQPPVMHLVKKRPPPFCGSSKTTCPTKMFSTTQAYKLHSGRQRGSKATNRTIQSHS